MERRGRRGRLRCVLAWLGLLGKVKFRQGRHVPVSFVGDRRDWAGVLRQEAVSSGEVGFGRQAEVRRVLVSSGASWQVW